MDHSDIIPLGVLAVGLILVALRGYRKSKFVKLNPLSDARPHRPSPWRVIYLNSPTLRLLKLRRLKFPWVTVVISALLLAIFIFENSAAENFAIDRNLILTPETLNWKSLSLAQVLHGGWSHLYNNVITFILFGVIVENWLGSTRYLLTYLAGGYVGIFGYVKYLAPPEVIVLGASANVSAVIGAYAIFRVTIWRKIYGEMMGENNPGGSLLPQLLFYIYFVFGDDLVGLKHKDAGVAFGAHVIGSIVGIVAALIYIKFSPQGRWTADRFESKS